MQDVPHCVRSMTNPIEPYTYWKTPLPNSSACPYYAPGIVKYPMASCFAPLAVFTAQLWDAVRLSDSDSSDSKRLVPKSPSGASVSCPSPSMPSASGMIQTRRCADLGGAMKTTCIDLQNLYFPWATPLESEHYMNSMGFDVIGQHIETYCSHFIIIIIIIL